MIHIYYCTLTLHFTLMHVEFRYVLQKLRSRSNHFHPLCDNRTAGRTVQPKSTMYLQNPLNDFSVESVSALTEHIIDLLLEV